MATPRSGFWGPFLLGLAAGGVGAALVERRNRRRFVDPRLIKWPREGLTPVVVVPGIMGSGLQRPDGTRVWLSWGNAVGSHALTLPCVLPLCDSKDELLPSGLLGAESLLPRLFGFTEYADLLELLQGAGFRGAGVHMTGKPSYHIFSYDWRRDLVESARRLEERLDQLADSLGEPDARFNIIGHSMGGLVARYYLRYGGADPRDGMPVTWAGARRIKNLVLVAVPNGGSIGALDAIFHGNRVGLSTTTLAASVVAGMPAIYELLPPAAALSFVNHRGEPVALDLHDPETWRRHEWSAFGAFGRQRLDAVTAERQQRFAEAALVRARAFHAALNRRPDTACPVRVLTLGGDCLPTLARAVLPERAGQLPRFNPLNPAEAEAMYEAGDGRVTRASVLASFGLGAHDDSGCGLPEVAQCFFGSADHHGIYGEPTFQNILLRLLLRPALPKALADAQPDSAPLAG
jgi:pimeloyl-ACP methyl ester carboxylesterase